MNGILCEFFTSLDQLHGLSLRLVLSLRLGLSFGLVY